MPVIHIDRNNFNQTIASNELVVIDFWAEWCQPCKAFASTYEEVAKKYPDIVFAKINIEQEQELAEVFNVRSIPLLTIFKEHVVIFSESGSMPASALVDLIEQAKTIDMTEVKRKIEEGD